MGNFYSFIPYCCIEQQTCSADEKINPVFYEESETAAMKSIVHNHKNVDKTVRHGNFPSHSLLNQYSNAMADVNWDESKVVTKSEVSYMEALDRTDTAVLWERTLIVEGDKKIAISRDGVMKSGKIRSLYENNGPSSSQFRTPLEDKNRISTENKRQSKRHNIPSSTSYIHCNDSLVIAKPTLPDSILPSFQSLESSVGNEALNGVETAGRATWPCVGVHAYYHHPRRVSPPSQSQFAIASVGSLDNSHSSSPDFDPKRKTVFSSQNVSPISPLDIQIHPAPNLQSAGGVLKGNSSEREKVSTVKRLSFLRQRQPWKG